MVSEHIASDLNSMFEFIYMCIQSLHSVPPFEGFTMGSQAVPKTERERRQI
jgi:hypothetical protein